jgi:hypothetical protein
MYNRPVYRIMKKTLFTLLILAFLCSTGFSQYADTENTIQLKSAQESPKATIQEVAWIAGNWRGEALGGITEEIWSPPSGGSMMCVFRLIRNDQVSFYEICTITEEEGTLIMRIKHFDPVLKGWEEKDEREEFPLVRLSGNRAWFSGLTFERISDQEMNVYVQIGDEPGKEQEVKFNYRRNE